MHPPDDILLGELVRLAAEEHPNRPALVSNTWRLTFGDVHARTNALAHALAARGVRRGDPVLVQGCGSVQTVLSFFSVLKANGLAVVVPPGTSADGVAELIEAHRARVLVTEACMLRELPALAGRTQGVGHVVVCGVVRPEQLPELPGIVPSEQAVSGHDRSVPPAAEGEASDPAFIIGNGTGSLVHTHRQVLGRLPTAPMDDQGAELGSVRSLEHIDLVIRAFRDGCRLTFIPERTS